MTDVLDPLPLPPAVGEFVWQEVIALRAADPCALGSLLRIGLGPAPSPARLRAVAAALRMLADEYDERAER